MSSSSYQPSAASPIGPSTSSTSTRNSKLDQIIQVRPMIEKEKRWEMLM